MKKRALIIGIISVTVIAILFSALKLYEKANSAEIEVCNKCLNYSEQYLEVLPKDKSVLSEIYSDTQTFLSTNTYNKFFNYTDYYKRYKNALKSGAIYGSKFEFRKEYYNRVIMLRLKVLAVLNYEDEYIKEFCKYFDEIEACIYTATMYNSYWRSEKNYPLEKGNTLFNLIENGYNILLEKCSDNIDRYIVLQGVKSFYSGIDGCEDDMKKISEEISEIIKKHEREIIIEKVQTWTGFVSKELQD